MNRQTEITILLAVGAFGVTAYLACGTFIAGQLGLGGITWLLFVATWPVVLGVVAVLACIGIWALLTFLGFVWEMVR